MKILYPFLFFILIFIGCKKKDKAEATTSASFAQSELTLPSQAGKASFTVKWSLTEWEISTAASGFISNISHPSGGSANLSSTTTVSFDYSANLLAEIRLQEVFLTNKSTGAKSKITIRQTTHSPEEVAVTATVQYQQITGFGGMNNVWAAPVLTLNEVEKMYSSGGLGYNMMRIMIWPNKADWGRDVATTLKAQSLGARILASPWTPPSAMKSTNSNLHGHLLPAKYPDYVQHLNDFIDYMKAQGITIEAVSIQNEPDWSPEYDGCEWTPEQILDFVKNHAGGIKAKVLAAEAVNFKKMYTDPVLNDAVAVNNLDIAGGHLYGGGLADYPLARAKGKEIWMTEHLLNETNNGLGWDQAMVFAKELNDCMQANFNAYFWWYLKRSYSMLGDGDKGTVMGETLKRGYVMSHYAKYATGRKRIQIGNINNNNNVQLTAYAGDNDITVIILNQGTAPVPSLKINLPVAVKSVEMVETTESQNMVAKNPVLSDTKNAAIISLAPRSVVSIKFNK
ncbi:hypothetical protein ACFSJU_10015 [Paradesertivirga mongoliensis]|uniref:Uncharacterized protein n=1 Tax=Paradesertivirga mongoliensis TaxID=2100740 RepID=A0ABW4ZLQ7_9SPHI|nr:hypothetical protein [Pedobacter mongoliensis]